MPFKRKNSPFWQIRKYNLPGYGDTGAISSRSKSKAVASRMEELLVDIANKSLIDPSWLVLIEGICQRNISLPEVMKAKNQGRLEILRISLNDPEIDTVIETYREVRRVDSSVHNGLTKLSEIAGKDRMSSLTSKRITSLLIDCESRYNIKRNSVYGKVYRAISSLLEFHYGKAEKLRIMVAVNYKREDDTREVHLSPDEINRLLDACTNIGRPDLGVLVQMALITSADRGVLLQGKARGKEYRGLLVRDVQIVHDSETGLYTGKCFLDDKKTKSRKRTVLLPHALCEQLLILCENKKGDDPVFPIKYQSLKGPWTKARQEADLLFVWFKDLRAQTAIYAEEAGIPQTVIMKTLGHSNEAMTRRYQRRKAVMNQSQVEGIFSEMLGSGTDRIANTG